MPTVFITSGTTYVIPNDYFSLVSIECIGAGSKDAGSFGGAGGAYAKITSLALTPGQSITIQIGASAAATPTTNTWFNGANLAASSVGAQGGNGYTGGSVASSVGTVKFAGGNTGSFGTGGGGAAGPLGAGGASAANAGGAGGNGGGSAGSNNNGGNNFGGTGGGAGGTTGSPGTDGGGGGGGTAGVGGDGGNGTEWDATHGSGGGGGGGTSGGGNGGLYGGGGGNGAGRVAGPGLIVFTYIAAFVPSAKASLTAGIIAAAAIASPWDYTFLGGAQPYAPKKNAPSLIESVVNDPPFQHPGRTAQQNRVITQQWQPPEWPYAFMGNAQPLSLIHI